MPPSSSNRELEHGFYIVVQVAGSLLVKSPFRHEPPTCRIHCVAFPEQKPSPAISILLEFDITFWANLSEFPLCVNVFGGSIGSREKQGYQTGTVAFYLQAQCMQDDDHAGACCWLAYSASQCECVLLPFLGVSRFWVGEA